MFKAKAIAVSAAVLSLLVLNAPAAMAQGHHGAAPSFHNPGFSRQAPVERQPQFRGNPGEFRGNPGEFRGNPGEFRGNPGEFRGNPGEFRGNPGAFRGNPGAFRGNPGYRGVPGPVYRGFGGVVARNPYPGRWTHPGFNYFDGYRFGGRYFGGAFFARPDYCATEWMFDLGRHSWYHVGFGWVNYGPAGYYGPMTVMGYEQVFVGYDAYGTPMYETVPVYYNAYWDNVYGGYFYTNMRGLRISVRF